jgi:hypothetical protein
MACMHLGLRLPPPQICFQGSSHFQRWQKLEKSIFRSCVMIRVESDPTQTIGGSLKLSYSWKIPGSRSEQRSKHLASASICSFANTRLQKKIRTRIMRRMWRPKQRRRGSGKNGQGKNQEQSGNYERYNCNYLERSTETPKGVLFVVTNQGLRLVLLAEGKKVPLPLESRCCQG